VFEYRAYSNTGGTRGEAPRNAATHHGAAMRAPDGPPTGGRLPFLEETGRLDATLAAFIATLP
jgi:hypothetical protein